MTKGSLNKPHFIFSFFHSISLFLLLSFFLSLFLSFSLCFFLSFFLTLPGIHWHQSYWHPPRFYATLICIFTPVTWLRWHLVVVIIDAASSQRQMLYFRPPKIVNLLRSKYFFVDFGGAPKARFLRDCHVTPKRHICDVLAVIWPKSRVNRPTRKGRSAAYKTPTIKFDRRTDIIDPTTKVKT